MNFTPQEISQYVYAPSGMSDELRHKVIQALKTDPENEIFQRKRQAQRYAENCNDVDWEQFGETLFGEDKRQAISEGQNAGSIADSQTNSDEETSQESDKTQASAEEPIREQRSATRSTPQRPNESTRVPARRFLTGRRTTILIAISVVVVFGIVEVSSREVICEGKFKTVSSKFQGVKPSPDYSSTETTLIHDAGTNRLIDTSGILNDLQDAAGRLMSVEEQALIPSITPDRTAIRDSKVNLKWSDFGPFDHYRIVINDLSVNPDQTPPTEIPNYQSRQLELDLVAGHIYAWKVFGYHGEDEYVPSGFEHQWAVFKVLDVEQLKTLDELLAEIDSNFARAIVYAQFGLRSDARRLILELLSQNPKSDLLKSWTYWHAPQILIHLL